MPDDTKPPAAPPAAPRNPTPPAAQAPRKAPDPAEQVAVLREKYDALARQSAEAAAAGDEPALVKIRPQKLIAFQAWNKANEALVQKGKPDARLRDAARFR